MSDLADLLLDVFHELPQGLGYRFQPEARLPTDPTNPRDAHYDGVCADRWLEGERVLRASGDGATYCCGVTLEVWWSAMERAGGSVPLSLAEAPSFIAEWFCPVMGHGGVAEALVARGWGEAVPAREGRRGDLVQYWRSTDLARPSGHSAILLGWEGDRMHYASSQPSTGGVGVTYEDVQPGWAIHVVRPRLLTLP